jgi:hypothetical protein
MAPPSFLEITVRNMIPNENILVGTLSIAVISEGTQEPILLNVFLLGAFFQATNSQ